MIIRILPNQIPPMWNHIKYAVSKVLRLSGDDFTTYTVKLIHELLTEKAQCFVRLDDNRNLIALGITRIIAERYSNKKYLFFEIAYSYKVVPTSEWQQNIDYIKEFAKSVGCTHIETSTAIKRMGSILESVGFVENRKIYSLDI